MPNYWPKGIDIKDISSPREILESAQQDWQEHSDGLLTLVIQDTRSTKGDKMFIVHAKHIPSNRTVTLFSVIHRIDSPYPARIQPNNDELPDFLKKQSGMVDIVSKIGMGASGDSVNKWICDTPGEFRSRLEDVFNLSSLKSQIVSLASVDDSMSSDNETRIIEDSFHVETDTTDSESNAE